MGLSVVWDSDIEHKLLGKNREHQKLGFVGRGRQFFLDGRQKLIVDMWGISVLFEPPQRKNVVELLLYPQ